MRSITVLLLVLPIVATALALAAWMSVRLSEFVRRRSLRFLLASATSFFFVGAPAVLVLWLAALMKVWYRVWYIDLPFFMLLGPSAAGVVSAYVAIRRTQAGGFSRALVVTYAWAGFFGAINILNRCASGWCGRYGFPFLYYEWSDAVVVFNGVVPEPFRPEAVGLNALVFLLVLLPLLLTSTPKNAARVGGLT